VTVTFLAARDGPPRVAYAVGRAAGGAVARNRLRRRLRAITGEHGPGLRPGAYLIGAGATAGELPYAELRTALVATLEEASR
jgi:ribonuclease P protein component